MKLYVPEIGDTLRLTAEWTFVLHEEYRNSGLMSQVGMFGRNDYRLKRTSKEVTMKPGTVLVVDRIYVRKGAEDFSSITFRLKSSAEFKNCRFWAKLLDCNKIEFDIESMKTAASKPKLVWWNVPNYKNRDNVNYEHAVNEPDAHHQEVHRKVYNTSSVRMQHESTTVPEYLVKIEYDENWKVGHVISVLQRTKVWDCKASNVKFTLMTVDGKEIGTYGTLTTMKKHAKAHYEKI